jgi:dihydroorotate dehydrogenase electron transfer subunit
MTTARPAGVDFVVGAWRAGGSAVERRVPVTAVERVGSEYWRLSFAAWPGLAASRPGQFVMIRPASSRHILRRPFTIYAANRSECDVVFRITGSGTAALAALTPGEGVSVLGPLGNGFDTPGVRRAVIVGRGVGLASLDRLARELLLAGVPTTVIASARRPDLWLALEELGAAGAEVLALDDRSGSSGLDRVAALLQARIAPGVDCFVCGSSRLLSLATRIGSSRQARVQAALEAPMACGIGTCHACPIQPGSHTEGALVCVDGPVFEARVA